MRLLLAALLLSACAETAAEDARYAERESAQLRAQFPPGKSTRAEVAARWGKPETTLTRPSIGWSLPFVLDVEQKTGAYVARVEKYVGPTATSAGFLTLEHVWFFYDSDENVVDAEWERTGD